MMVSSTFKPSLHCQHVVDRARRALFRMKRTFIKITPSIFSNMYPVFVRPILEYAVQAASPYAAHDVQLVEKFQGRATRMVQGLGRPSPDGTPRPSYPERLRKLNLHSMSRRRRRADLILAHSIRTGRVDLPQEEFFRTPSSRNLRGHPHNLLHLPSKKQRRSKAFSVRMPPLWNKLPQQVKAAPTVTAFKRALDAYWQTVFPRD